MQSKSDKELIDSYVEAADEAALAELVARYSPMVYRACLRLLGNDHDAEDAVQAAFVVLARKAGSLRKEGRLNGWLHRVARLVSLEALRKRTQHERHQTGSALWQESLAANLSEADRETVLRQVDTALDSLSAVLREAVVLRYLRGFSEQEAAAAAGCAVSAMKWRTSDGIAKLRQRLAKRGVALGGVALVSLLTSEASAAVPETLLPSILAVVKTAAATGAAATTATTTAAMLAKGAMKAMFIAKVKMVAAVAAAVVLTGTAVPVGIAMAQAVGKESAKVAWTNKAEVEKKAKNDVGVRPLCDPAKVTIPEVDFRQASLYDVLSMLHEASAAYGEPHTKALPMVLVVDNKDGRPVSFVFQEIPLRVPKEVDAEIANTDFPTVTFTARQISVMHALESVAQITGMDLRIKDGTAIISPKTKRTVTESSITWELRETRTDADGSRVFVLSVTSGKPPKVQTHSRKLGEEIEGFRLVKFEKKALHSSKTPMHGYVLTLQKGDIQLPLWLTMKSR